MAEGRRYFLITFSFVLLLCFQNCGKFVPYSAKTTQSSSLKINNKFHCTHPELRGFTEGRARRLTHAEVKNSVAVIFGAKVVSALKNTFSLYAVEAFEQDVYEFDPKHTRSHVDALAEIAIAVGDKATELGGSVFPQCLLESNTLPPRFVLTDANCNKLFVQNLGRMIFRRPLSSDQADDYSQILGRVFKVG